MLATEPRPTKLLGHPKPRIAPPEPARTELAAFRSAAKAMGITLMPWQETAARYLTARGPGKALLYREVCIVVARQNGKTTLMKPHIIRALRAGRKITHIAQNRELPRDMFGLIADALSDEPDLFPKRRGKVIWPRFGAGQEDIQLVNGGRYRIAASNRGGGRGWPNDMIIVDELREQRDFLAIAAATPTLIMSPDPQVVYLSNMGDDESVVLNEVSERAGSDPTLAYLEWSAAPERDAGDREGWAEANPAVGHYPGVLLELERAYAKRDRPGYGALFETEHLCRRVTSMEERVVDERDWLDRHAPIGKPTRPSMAVSLDPSGRRASAVLAWQTNGQVHLRVEADVTGSPIDTERLGRDLQARASKLGVKQVGFDDWTDRDLARWLTKARPVVGHEFANASDKFDRIVRSDGLIWDHADEVTDALRWLTRKPHEVSGAWQAVRANDEHSVTAGLAAIRAVWLASEPIVGFKAFSV